MVIDIKTGKRDDEMEVRRNSLKAWFLAARPKTLSGAAMPVIVGSAYAWKELLCGTDVTGVTDLKEWLPIIVANVLCFLFAFVMQIDANFVNDYWDCKKGRDNAERLGPLRACQQGWVTMRAMKWAIALTTLLACAVGLPLAFLNPNLIILGLACVVFCFLYTTCLASLGLGDLLVVVFFGLVPVCGTTYVLCGNCAWLLGLACGLVVDTLLIVNNYRDIDNDRHSGKKTLVVLIGKKYSEWLYLFLPTIALVLVLLQYGWSQANIILCFGSYFLFTQSWNEMRVISKGKALNKVLGKTARNIFAFGILISILIILA